MKVTLLTCTPDAQRLVAAAAQNCYSADGPVTLTLKQTDKKILTFLDKILSQGHESVLEHAVFTFAVEDASRTLMAEITRHRIASFSIKSQRYVDEKAFGYVLPPTIEQNPEALAAFENAMEAARSAYAALCSLDIPKEDARFVLPGACTTHIVFTMNARELRHFFRLRCCHRAQWEIRSLAEEILRLCRAEAPALFAKAGPRCVWESCPEGKMTCGQASQVRSLYRSQEDAP